MPLHIPFQSEAGGEAEHQMWNDLAECKLTRKKIDLPVYRCMWKY